MVGGSGREPHLAEFSTTVRGLLALRDWLAAHRVSQVVMEATGVYWKPVWHILEDDFEHARSTSASAHGSDTAGLSARSSNSIISAIWHILTNGELYREAGANYFAQRDPQRATKRLVAQLERLGHTVTIQEAAAA